MKNWQKLTLISLHLFLLSACTKAPLELGRYSEPEWTANEKDLVIEVFTTNNFSGKLAASKSDLEFLKDIDLKLGGADLLLAYREISKKRNPDKNLWLDSGGIFDPNGDRIHLAETQHVLARMDYDALAFTEQELVAINPQIKSELKAPFVNSHLIDLSSGAPFSSDAIRPWRIVEKSGIRIGIIAVTDYLNVKKISPEKLRGLYFEDMVLGVLRAKNELEKNKVHAKVLVAQIESSCLLKDNLEELHCANSEDALRKLMARLPPKTIDLVVASPNLIAAGKINDIPVIMAPGFGQWLARAQLIFSKEESKLKDINLLPPIRVCNKFFHETGDCHLPFASDKDRKQRMETIKQSVTAMRASKFWGHEIIPDTNLAEELKTIRTQGNLSR